MLGQKQPPLTRSPAENVFDDDDRRAFDLTKGYLRLQAMSYVKDDNINNRIIPLEPSPTHHSDALWSDLFGRGQVKLVVHLSTVLLGEVNMF